MLRNAEVIRQWKILRTLDASRHGESVATLARLCEVTERTVWRDVAALQEAGFPLVDEKPEGRTKWKLVAGGLKGLNDSGLTLSDAMDKVAAALPPRMRAFLDRLPAVLNVKATPQKKREESRYRKHIASLLTAVLDQRQVKMQYYSASSRQTKEYLIEPYRLAYAQGGMYLLAQVPKYRQLRTLCASGRGMRPRRFAKRAMAPFASRSMSVTTGRCEAGS
ncbi:MAG: WYL domain-containing protein [Vicinamibacterales bacterium]